MKNVSNKVKLVFAALLVLAGSMVALNVATASPASAMWGNHLYHMQDDGYDEPFLVKCKNLSTHYVREYETSEAKCNTVLQVYVNPGTRIMCTIGGDWYLAFDETGWRNVSPYYGVDNCVYQLD